MRYALLIMIGCLLPAAVVGQEYRFRSYRVEQGLPSDVVKAVAQDTLGFVWIATDDGLVKYDGLRFTTYKSAVHSQYTKGFLNTRDGKLLAIGDLDLIEIQNHVDTVIFKSLVNGARYPTDTTIWYPKFIYEDRSGNIWLGEPQSALRFNEGKPIKRFDFGEANRSPVFIRSYYFFEDDQDNLYTLSYQGTIFRYVSAEDKFVQLKASLPRNISHVVFRDGHLWIGAADGLYRATPGDVEVKQVEKVVPIPGISHLNFLEDKTLWVSTFGKNQYRVKTTGEVSILDYDFKGINSSFTSKENDLWVSTDKGLVLVQSNRFQLADLNSQTHFIEAIAYDSARNLLYYCHKETLVELRQAADGEWLRNVIYENPEGYFQSLQFGKRGLWASSAFDVLLFQDGKLKHSWNFLKQGNFVHDVYLDDQQNLWLSQARNPKVMMITDSLMVKYFNIPLLTQSEVNLVRKGSRGMYAAANGIGSYLFLKTPEAKDFVNISLPVHFKVQGDFNIHDMVALGDVMWIASTEGLLRYDHQTIDQVQLGQEFTNFSVSSVEVLDDQNILFSNSYGLFRYNTTSGDYWLYDENAGLPSNTITDHGIFIDKRKRLWVGTSYGLATARESVISNRPTATPFCVDARVNGESTRFINGITAPYGSFLNLQFSSITFPENKINMQWRMIHEDSVWHPIRNSEVSLSDLPAGKHTLEVRAKKNTGEGWSDSTVVHITIGKPFWQKAEFIFLIVVVTILIAWVSYAISARMSRKRREFLQNLVDQRTLDLKQANEELVLRNTELDRFVYSASHDLSAPLKSILGLIAIARLDKPSVTQEHYLSMMERSVKKLEEFIQEVVSFSRNTRMPIKWEACHFTTLVENLLLDHQYAPDFSKIKFEIEDLTGHEMITDLARLKIILNNLISNAIKFHWFDDTRTPFVKILLSKHQGHYRLRVQDNGRGIGHTHLAKIFDMFYRATEKAQGSGLGLYILKETVHKLGGSVEATSVLDEGTTFVVTLPVPENI